MKSQSKLNQASLEISIIIFQKHVGKLRNQNKNIFEKEILIIILIQINIGI